MSPLTSTPSVACDAALEIVSSLTVAPVNALSTPAARYAFEETPVMPMLADLHSLPPLNDRFAATATTAKPDAGCGIFT